MKPGYRKRFILYINLAICTTILITAYVSCRLETPLLFRASPKEEDVTPWDRVFLNEEWFGPHVEFLARLGYGTTSGEHRINNFTPISIHHSRLTSYTEIDATEETVTEVPKTQWPTFDHVPYTSLYVYNHTALYSRRLNGTHATLVFGVWQSKAGSARAICVLELDNNKQILVPADIELTDTGPPRYLRYDLIFVMIWCPTHRQVIPRRVAVSSDFRHNNSKEGTYPALQFLKVAMPARTSDVRNKVAICYKHLYSFTSAASLVEIWELQRLLGASKVYVYGYHKVSPSVDKVIRYYVRSGFVQLQPFTEPWKHDKPGRTRVLSSLYHQGQHVAYTDCAHRFSGLYEYLVFTDLDEFIISTLPEVKRGFNQPPVTATYQDLVATVFDADEVSRRRVCALMVPWARVCLSNTTLPHRTHPGLFSRQYISVDESVNNYKYIARASLLYVGRTHYPQECRNSDGEYPKQKFNRKCKLRKSCMAGYRALKVAPSVARTYHYRQYNHAELEEGVQPCLHESEALRYLPTDLLQKRVLSVMAELKAG